MTWWHYLLLANVYLTLFFAFYAIFLRKETFFNLNRLYLVSSALLSFFIPVIQSTWIQNLFITQRVQQTISLNAPAVISRFNIAAMPVHQLTLGQILGGIYVTGMLILTFRFVYQLAVINWVINQPKSDTSYSFFNRVKIEDRDTDNDVISAHENVHARQWHSVDVLLLEAIMIINWFNPVVYLYRNAVKYIHEFIADRDALKSGTDKAEYAMLLLSQTFITPPYHLVNPFFNSSLLKQRIQMLHKNRSHWVMLVKYGLSAPLFMLMLVLSSATVDHSKTIQAISNTANRVFKTPAVKTFTQGELSPQDQADLAAVIKQHQISGGAIPANNGLIPVSPSNDIKNVVDVSADFPGGMEGFYNYLTGHIRYPAKARQNNVQGKVICSFIVEKDGSLSDVKVLRGIGSGADEEAVRVLSAMPKWYPGMEKGMIVRQQYTVPITFALTDKAIDNNNEVFTSVEKPATFPGGLEAFYKYLSSAVRYPAEARQKNLQGKVVVSYIIEKDGSVSNARVLKDIGGGLGDEALRVVRLSPKWLPAIQNGAPVREMYTAPISFSIADEKSENLSLNERAPDTSRMEAHFASVVKAQTVTTITDAKLSNAVLAVKPAPQNNKGINAIKDRTVKGMIGEKTTNGIVSIVTKHKSFFDQDILSY